MTILSNNSPQPIAQLILAHGAGAGMHHEFMQTLSELLSERGVTVHRFNFEYMQTIEKTGKRRPPDRMPKLLAYYQSIIESVNETLPLFIGGKSMGGRVASMLIENTQATGALCFGYPFHPPGKLDKLRIDHLQTLSSPVQILQGERDTFGTREEVSSYALSDAVSCTYIPDGDHSFKPRKSSGHTIQSNLTLAAESSVAFIKECLNL